MSLSIVTVALNAAKDLALTIESVLQQDYTDVELVLVDGGSHDESAAVYARYADSIDRFIQVEDGGIYHAMNLALDHCSREYVLFLNAKDTLFSAEILSRLMACKEPDVDVFFGNHMYLANGREYFKRSCDYDLLAQTLLSGAIDHAWLARLPGHQATFVRTDLLKRLRFNTDIDISADHDLLVRAYRAGASFQYIDQTVSHYVGGGFSAHRPSRLMLEWCALYREWSVDPSAVDRFFLGDVVSPFGPQGQLTGLFVSGYYAREGLSIDGDVSSTPIHWCRPDGARLRSPAQGSSKSLRISGFCPFDGQVVRFFQGLDEIGVMAIDKGWFRKTVEFSTMLSSMTIVEMFTSRFRSISTFDDRIVGVAITSFAFELIEEAPQILRKGERVAFSAINRTMTERMFGVGWSDQEREHIWITGEAAELRFKIAPGVTSLVLRCKGNPFITDAAQRGVVVSINGNGSGRHLLDPDAARDVILACPIPTDGIVKLLLSPIERRCPPEDKRTLGICMLALECR